MLRVNALSKELRALLDSYQKKELQALSFTNKAAALAKLLSTNNCLPSTPITSLIYGGTCSKDPLLISGVLIDYFASSMTTDGNTITANISPVSSASLLRSSLHPGDINPLSSKKNVFPCRIGLTSPSPFEIWRSRHSYNFVQSV